jgi:hypothetical protein
MRVEIEPVPRRYGPHRGHHTVPELAHRDLDAAVALDQHVLEHAALLDVEILVLLDVAKGVRGRVCVVLLGRNAGIGLRIDPSLPLEATQGFDLGANEVLGRDRLLALLERVDLSRGELVAIKVVARLLGLGAAVVARLKIFLELLNVTGRVWQLVPPDSIVREAAATSVGFAQLTSRQLCIVRVEREQSARRSQDVSRQ